MHLKVPIRETEKNPKNPLVWAKKPKKPPKKKKPTGLGFLKKLRFFPTLYDTDTVLALSDQNIEKSI